MDYAQEYGKQEYELGQESVKVETIDPNIEVEQEKDEGHSEAMAQAEHNFNSSL
jgi:hypothetical protein